MATVPARRRAAVVRAAVRLAAHFRDATGDQATGPRLALAAVRDLAEPGVLRRAGVHQAGGSELAAANTGAAVDPRRDTAGERISILSAALELADRLRRRRLARLQLPTASGLDPLPRRRANQTRHHGPDHRSSSRCAAASTRPRQTCSGPSIVVTRHYMAAGLYSFYLRDHPAVFTAGKYLGKRSTNFDHWPDTELSDPALHGRTLILDGDGGKDGVPWEKGWFRSRNRSTNTSGSRRITRAHGRIIRLRQFGGTEP